MTIATAIVSMTIATAIGSEAAILIKEPNNLDKPSLHNGNDDKCIEIVKQCKEAISSRDDGGKVLIIDVVVGIPSGNVNYSHSQYLMDMQMLSVLGAKQRSEEQRKYLLINVGFTDYKILPIRRSRPIVKVYPQ